MTEQISRDLIDMGEHPLQVFLALVFTVVMTLGCLIGSGVVLMVLYQIRKMIL